MTITIQNADESLLKIIRALNGGRATPYKVKKMPQKPNAMTIKALKQCHDEATTIASVSDFDAYVKQRKDALGV